jgi:hypothetical protein
LGDLFPSDEAAVTFGEQDEKLHGLALEPNHATASPELVAGEVELEG